MSKTFVVEVTVPDGNVEAVMEGLVNAMVQLDPFGSVAAYELDLDHSTVVSVGDLLFQ